MFTGQRVESLRQFNKYDYSQDIRPYIITSVNANIIADTDNFSPESGGGQMEEEVVLVDLENIEAKAGTILDLTTTTLAAYELSTPYINSFTTKPGNNVTFKGTTDSNEMIWNSGTSTLNVDANMKVGKPFIHLNHLSNNYGVPQSEYNTDIGMIMQYWNVNFLGTQQAFFGMDGNTNRLRFLTGVSKGTFNDKIVTDNGESGHNEYGDLEIHALYVSKIMEHDNSTTGLTIQSTNDLNIISGGDLNFSGTNVNYNISGGYSLVNTSEDMNFTSISSNLNLTVSSGDTNIDTFNGTLDIQVAGDSSDLIIIQNTLGDINIVTGSTNVDSVHIDTDGGVLMTTESMKVTTANSAELLFDGTNGLTTTMAKTDFQKWISFKDFDAIDGYWFTNRSLITGLPIHYWKKERNEEYSTIYVDVDLSSRLSSLKGYKLKKIYFGYKIENSDIFDLNTIITKKTFDPTNVTPLTVTQIGYNDINLEAGINTANHYRGIEIGSPFYIQNDNILNIELSISSSATSDFLFYGCNLEFERNDL
jgi:hypothetical protein